VTTQITIPDSVYDGTLPTMQTRVTGRAVFENLGGAGRWIAVNYKGQKKYFRGTGETILRDFLITDGNSNGSNLAGYDIRFPIFRQLIQNNGTWAMSVTRFIPSFAGGSTEKNNTKLVSAGPNPRITMLILDSAPLSRSYSFVYRGRTITGNTNSLSAVTTNYQFRAPTVSVPSSAANARMFEMGDLQRLAQAARAAEAANSNGRSSSSSRTSRRPGAPAVAPPARFTPRPQPAPITVDFGPGLQFGPSPSELANKPYLMQRFVITGADGNPQQVTRRFLLKIIPNSFQYSNVNAAWNEVDRPGNFAITDWAKYNLLKVSFKFLIAADVSPDRLIDDSPSSIPRDGLLSSIEPELREIRAIAGAPHPVSLINFQSYLTNTMRFPFIEDKSGAKFVIADMSVTTSRFLPSGIMDASAAEVSMTLTEFVEPVTQLAKLPPIQSQQRPPSTSTNRPPAANNRGLYSDSWTIPIPRTQQP